MMKAVRDLERTRNAQCRLTADRALQTLEEAAAFLQDRGMLTRFPDCALPSLFGACHEEPGRAGGRGFDLWPKTKWIWSFQVAHSSGAVLTKLHRGKSLFLSTATARMFDPLVRQDMDEAVGDEARLLEHLGAHGPSMSEDVEVELGWEHSRLKRVRVRLERVGAVLSEGLVFDDPESWHFERMMRWDQRIERLEVSGDPYAAAVLAGVRAAVVAPEKDLASWFSWRVPGETIERLVAARKLYRPAPGLLAMAE
jgi:hypothetical protein